MGLGGDRGPGAWAVPLCCVLKVQGVGGILQGTPYSPPPRLSSHLWGGVDSGAWVLEMCIVWAWVPPWSWRVPHYCSEGPGSEGPGGAWGGRRLQTWEGSRTGLRKAFPPEGGGAGPPAPAPARSLRSPYLREEPLPGAARRWPCWGVGGWRECESRGGREGAGVGRGPPRRPRPAEAVDFEGFLPRGGGRGSGHILLPCLWLRCLSLF